MMMMMKKKMKEAIVSVCERGKKKKEKKENFFLLCLVYRDVYGIPRLIETLHIHQWPNMNLKGRRYFFKDVF